MVGTSILGSWDGHWSGFPIVSWVLRTLFQNFLDVWGWDFWTNHDKPKRHMTYPNASECLGEVFLTNHDYCNHHETVARFFKFTRIHVLLNLQERAPDLIWRQSRYHPKHEYFSKRTQSKLMCFSHTCVHDPCILSIYEYMLHEIGVCFNFSHPT
jgi:hypothetical protein